jgi:O-antigen/teichoic acid export membrane protein
VLSRIIQLMGTNGKNALANLTGNLLGPLIGVVMTPFYLHTIGLEGLGLVGFMTMTMTVFNIFIAGASKTYQRDLAKARESAPQDLHALLHGGIIGSCVLGILLAGLILFVGLWFPELIQQKSSIDPEIIRHCVYLIAPFLGLNVISGIQLNALQALRDQVWPNLVSAASSVVVAFVGWISLSHLARVDIYYLCQLLGSLALCVAYSMRSRKARQATPSGTTRRSLGAVWGEKFNESGRVSLILIIHEGLGMVIWQLDRLLITSLLPLTSLGSYNLGANPARLVGVFTGPVSTVTFPELCALSTDSSPRVKLGEYSGRVTFILTLLLSSAIVALGSSGRQLLETWLGRGKVPDGAEDVLLYLSVGYFLLAIAGTFYSITVAYGQVGYGVYKNVGALIVMPALGYVLVDHLGIAGAALMWSSYGAVSVIICSLIVFRRHANLLPAMPYFIISAVSLAASILCTILIQHFAGDGFIQLVVSFGCAALFPLPFLVKMFGLPSQRWMHVLEIDTIPTPSIQ